MRKSKFLIISVTLMLLTSIVLSMAACTSYKDRVPEEIQDSRRTYDCDYHSLSAKTHISFMKDDIKYDIKGKLFTKVTDPLTLYKDGEKIGYADDSYHVVSQDDHNIIIDGKVMLIVEGNFELIGNSYRLYDAQGNQVGYAEFNGLCTGGAIFNNNDEAIAVYSKSLIFNDYTVTIYDNDIGSDEVLLLVVASYVSDYHADSKNNDDD